MHLVHPNCKYYMLCCLLAHDPLSSLAHLTITHIPLVAGNLPTNTHVCMHTHTHTHTQTHTDTHDTGPDRHNVNGYTYFSIDHISYKLTFEYWK